MARFRWEGDADDPVCLFYLPFAAPRARLGLRAGWCAGPEKRPLGRACAEHLLNAPYLAPTGATVPHPGASQSGGNTALDRGINREDDKITHGICSNC